MRKTKIICTLGPASTDEAVVREMILAGMNVARFNFSHGTHEEHLEKLELVKRLRAELGVPVATLLDTKGPEIRLRDFKSGGALLLAGADFMLTTREVEGNQSQASVTYKNLPQDVNPGTVILIDDGLIALEVLSVDGTDIHCRVRDGGPVSNHKGVNVPGVRLSMPYVSDADRADILFGIKNQFDFIAASFVRTAQDVLDIRGILAAENCRTTKIISKIENAEGVENLDSILAVSSGIMVARGDLGVEVPMEEIPVLQKVMIHKCVGDGKMVITATQMLESMVKNPRPTRAETSDVANAIYDGTSAIMLSGETAAGKYPVDAVRTMDTIAQRVEKDIDYVRRLRSRQETSYSNVTDAISHATCTTALDIGAAAIVPVTTSGRTARMVSKYRPPMPIVACTCDPHTYQQLALSWGVIPVMVDMQTETFALFEVALEAALKHSGVLNPGDLAVLTAGVPVGVSGTTNLLKVEQVGGAMYGVGLRTQLAVKGTVAVGQNTDELLANYQEGDIVVCRKADLSIMSVLLTASGVIAEERDPQSDILLDSIAGQRNIPVIVGVKDCTRLLRTGETVAVDAGLGTISPMII